MGPRGGDELNRVVPGKNYGYPIVSNGRHYSGKDIPDHETRPEFEAPKAWWTPVISPSSFIIYSGDVFPEWRGDLFITSLVFNYIERIDLDESEVVGQHRMFEEIGERIRDVRTGPDGRLYILTDSTEGRVIRVNPQS